MNRRNFFKAVTGSAFVAVAGCTGDGNETSEDIDVIDVNGRGSPGDRYLELELRNGGEPGRFEARVRMEITGGERSGEIYDDNSRVVYLPTDDVTTVRVGIAAPDVGPDYEFHYSVQRTDRPLPGISISSREVRLGQDVVFEPTDTLVADGSSITEYEWNVNGDVSTGAVVSDGEIQTTKEATYSPFYRSAGRVVNEVEHGLWVHLTVTDDEGRTGSASEKYSLEYSMAGADLRDVDLDDVGLASMNLEGANLAGVDLSNSGLGSANLSDANLRGTDLSRSTLIEANLEGADLRGANLAYAELGDANFRNADLTDATVSSRAEGADFTDATWSDGSRCSTSSCDGRAYQ